MGILEAARMIMQEESRMEGEQKAKTSIAKK